MQSIAVLAAQLALIEPHTDRAILEFVALCFWLSGGLLYIPLITLLFYRLVFCHLAPDDAGPTLWISMGAMAISTLAGTSLATGLPIASELYVLHPVIEGGALLFWAIGTWWLPLLVALFIWRHFLRRVPFQYDPANWGAVFPLGMYSAAACQLGSVLSLGFLDTIAMIFLVLALVVWFINMYGLGRRLMTTGCNTSS